MPENTEAVDNATQGAPAEQPERTFTQAEMDAIIGERLKRDRQKQFKELKAERDEPSCRPTRSFHRKGV